MLIKLTPADTAYLIRRRAGLSQTHMACQWGTSQPRVARWEGGHIPPPAELVDTEIDTVTRREYLSLLRRHLGLSMRQIAASCGGGTHTRVWGAENKDAYDPEPLIECLENLYTERKANNR